MFKSTTTLERVTKRKRFKVCFKEMDSYITYCTYYTPCRCNFVYRALSYFKEKRYRNIYYYYINTICILH